MRFDCDCHVHTKRSFCGENNVTIEALVGLMSKRGLKRFAVTDHSTHFYFTANDPIWKPDFVLNSQRIAENQDKATKSMRKHLSLIHNFSKKGVLIGMEIDVTFNGDLVIPPEIKDKLDIAVGSVHWLPGLSKENKPPLKKVVRKFLDITSILLEKDIDILAHPTGVFEKNGLIVPKEVVDLIIKAAIANNVALEINAHHKNPDAFFVKRCLDKGAILSIGTDSHSLEDFGDFSYHKKILSECGVNENDLKDILFSPTRRKEFSIGKRKDR